MGTQPRTTLRARFSKLFGKPPKVLHPCLLAAYPILALFARNFSEVNPTRPARAVLFSVAGTFALFWMVKLLVRERHKAGVITTLAILLFFSYGHAYAALEKVEISKTALNQHKLLIPVWGSTFLAGLWWMNKSEISKKLTKRLNVIAVIAILIPIVEIVGTGIHVFLVKREMKLPTIGYNRKEVVELQLQANDTPDIYYIILDAYSRDDTLLKLYNFDNTPFLNDLTEMGFYLARCSQSNYARTRSSLSSSLNLTYIPALNPHYHSGNNTIAGFDKLIKHSAIRKHLESLGYTTIAFETGFYWSEIHDAGIYLAPSRPPDGQPAVHNPSDFEIMLLDTSLGMLLLEGELPFPWQQQFSKEYNHRNRVLFTLDQLPALPAVPGPKFVFAHIVSPHRPLVFGPNGEMAGENQRFGYVDQVAYLNQRVIPILREIIEASSPAPIILLQSDHAAPFISPEDRMTILNAYLLPNGGDANLYPTISPVNSFRVVFNHYFGGGLDLLEDVSYYSKATKPFDYTVIPNTRPGCKNQ